MLPQFVSSFEDDAVRQQKAGRGPTSPKTGEKRAKKQSKKEGDTVSERAPQERADELANLPDPTSMDFAMEHIPDARNYRNLKVLNPDTLEVYDLKDKTYTALPDTPANRAWAKQSYEQSQRRQAASLEKQRLTLIRRDEARARKAKLEQDKRSYVDMVLHHIDRNLPRTIRDQAASSAAKITKGEPTPELLLRILNKPADEDPTFIPYVWSEVDLMPVSQPKEEPRPALPETKVEEVVPPPSEAATFEQIMEGDRMSVKSHPEREAQTASFKWSSFSRTPPNWYPTKVLRALKPFVDSNDQFVQWPIHWQGLAYPHWYKLHPAFRSVQRFAFSKPLRSFNVVLSDHKTHPITYLYSSGFYLSPEDYQIIHNARDRATSLAAKRAAAEERENDPELVRYLATQFTADNIRKFSPHFSRDGEDLSELDPSWATRDNILWYLRHTPHDLQNTPLSFLVFSAPSFINSRSRNVEPAAHSTNLITRFLAARWKQPDLPLVKRQIYNYFVGARPLQDIWESWDVESAGVFLPDSRQRTPPGNLFMDKDPLKYSRLAIMFYRFFLPKETDPEFRGALQRVREDVRLVLETVDPDFFSRSPHARCLYANNPDLAFAIDSAVANAFMHGTMNVRNLFSPETANFMRALIIGEHAVPAVNGYLSAFVPTKSNPEGSHPLTCDRELYVDRILKDGTKAGQVSVFYNSENKTISHNNPGAVTPTTTARASTAPVQDDDLVEPQSLMDLQDANPEEVQTSEAPPDASGLQPSFDILRLTDDAVAFEALAKSKVIKHDTSLQAMGSAQLIVKRSDHQDTNFIARVIDKLKTIGSLDGLKPVLMQTGYNSSQVSTKFHNLLQLEVYSNDDKVNKKMLDACRQVKAAVTDASQFMHVEPAPEEFTVKVLARGSPAEIEYSYGKQGKVLYRQEALAPGWTLVSVTGRLWVVDFTHKHKANNPTPHLATQTRAVLVNDKAVALCLVNKLPEELQISPELYAGVRDALQSRLMQTVKEGVRTCGGTVTGDIGRIGGILAQGAADLREPAPFLPAQEVFSFRHFNVEDIPALALSAGFWGINVGSNPGPAFPNSTSRDPCIAVQESMLSMNWLDGLRKALRSENARQKWLARVEAFALQSYATPKVELYPLLKILTKSRLIFRLNAFTQIPVAIMVAAIGLSWYVSNQIESQAFAGSALESRGALLSYDHHWPVLLGVDPVTWFKEVFMSLTIRDSDGHHYTPKLGDRLYKYYVYSDNLYAIRYDEDKDAFEWFSFDGSAFEAQNGRFTGDGLGVLFTRNHDADDDPVDVHLIGQVDEEGRELDSAAFTVNSFPFLREYAATHTSPQAFGALSISAFEDIYRGAIESIEDELDDEGTTIGRHYRLRRSSKDQDVFLYYYKTLLPKMFTSVVAAYGDTALRTPFLPSGMYATSDANTFTMSAIAHWLYQQDIGPARLWDMIDKGEKLPAKLTDEARVLLNRTEPLHVDFLGYDVETVGYPLQTGGNLQHLQLRRSTYDHSIFFYKTAPARLASAFAARNIALYISYLMNGAVFDKPYGTLCLQLIADANYVLLDEAESNKLSGELEDIDLGSLYGDRKFWEKLIHMAIERLAIPTTQEGVRVMEAWEDYWLRLINELSLPVIFTRPLAEARIREYFSEPGTMAVRFSGLADAVGEHTVKLLRNLISSVVAEGIANGTLQFDETDPLPALTRCFESI